MEKINLLNLKNYDQKWGLFSNYRDERFWNAAGLQSWLWQYLVGMIEFLNTIIQLQQMQPSRKCNTSIRPEKGQTEKLFKILIQLLDVDPVARLEVVFTICQLTCCDGNSLKSIHDKSKVYSHYYWQLNWKWDLIHDSIHIQTSIVFEYL